MANLKPSQDVQPLSAFRANAAGFLEQVRATKRPLVLTQHGKSAAVVLDVDEYESLVERSSSFEIFETRRPRWREVRASIMRRS